MEIRTIIIEDEEPARILLKQYLKEFPALQLIGEFADGFSGLRAINTIKPDLVFLDVQLPKITGFEILELIEHHPLIIFTTAYDQYALKAFEMSAVDYLLKPFSTDRLKTAINKAVEKFQMNASAKTEIDKVLEQAPKELLDRVVVKTGSKLKIIPVDEIRYIEADGDYVKIYIKEGSFLKEKTMKYFETQLDSKIFIRIHRSYILNINELNKIEPYGKDTYLAILKDNTELNVSYSGYKNLKAVLNF